MEYEEEKTAEQQGQENFHESQNKKSKGLLKDFMKKQGKKPKNIKTKNPIIIKIRIIGIIIAAVIVGLILLGGFVKILMPKKFNDANVPKQKAISTSYSEGTPTTGTDEDGNVVNTITVATNTNKTGYEFKYNNDPKYLQSVRDELEDEIVDSAADFTNFELAVLGTLMDNGADLSAYTKEELHCIPAFVQGEACTQNLDLRPNSEKQKGKKAGDHIDNYTPQKIEDLTDGEVPGVILIQRTNTNSTTPITLEYKQKEGENGFDKLVEENNKEAINYFTIDNNGNLIIAKWDHVFVDVTGEYPEGIDETEKDKSTGEKGRNIIKPEPISYSQYILEYKVPFDFLLQLLVTTEEPEFCMEFLNYVLDSKIVINIQEEETVTVTDVTKEYTVHNKDEKSVNYKINAAQQQIVTEDNYLLKNAKDDKGNECTNYTIQNLEPVKVHTEYTSHSYTIEVEEVDNWMIHLQKIYTKQNEIKHPTTEPIESENLGEYEEIRNETITDKNSINNDKDVKTFINNIEEKYEEKIIVPEEVTISEGVDEQGKYKIISLMDNGGTIEEVIGLIQGIVVYREARTVYREIEDGEFILPITINVITKKVDSTDKTKEIPQITYQYLLNDNETKYDLTTSINPLVDCTVSSLNIKEEEKIDLKTSITTTITEHPAPISTTKKDYYAVDDYGDYEKFLVAYHNSEGARNQLNSIDTWLFEMMEENETTCELVDIVKFLLYTYDGMDRGVTEVDLDLYELDEFKKINTFGTISINGTTLTKEEFVDCVKNYKQDSKYQSNFANYAEVIYDVCVSKNINPVVCVAVAGQESSFGSKIPEPFNYWGLGVSNDSNTGLSFNSMEEAVTYWCDLLIRYQTPGDNLNQIAVRNATKYAQYNDKFNPNIVSLYDLWSAYSYLGDYHSGRVWEGVDVKKFIDEYLDIECNHTREERTTGEEQAAYIVWYIDNGIANIAKEIFGSKAMNGGTLLSVVEVALQNEGKTADQIGLFNYTDCTGNSGYFFRDNWCAMFVSYCYSECDLIPSILDSSFSGCTSFVNSHIDLVRNKNDYIPQPGDLALYDWDGRGRYNHVEIVVECDGNNVKTIGGNTGSNSFNTSKVNCHTYLKNAPQITCYIQMN